MAERIGIDINLTGVSETVRGMAAIRQDAQAVRSAAESAATGMVSVGRESSAAAAEEMSLYQRARQNQGEAKGGARMLRGGMSMALMGINAGMEIASMAAGEGGGGGIGSAMNIGMGGAMGAASMSFAGPIGMAAGSAIGVISAMISDVRKTAAGVQSDTQKMMDAAEAKFREAMETGRDVATAWSQGGRALYGSAYDEGNALLQLSSSMDHDVPTRYLGSLKEMSASISDVGLSSAESRKAMDPAALRQGILAMNTWGISAREAGALLAESARTGMPFLDMLKSANDRAVAATAAGHGTRSGNLAAELAGYGSARSPEEVAAIELGGAKAGAAVSMLRNPDAWSATQRRALGAAGITAGQSPEERLAIAEKLAMTNEGRGLRGTGLEEARVALVGAGAGAPMLMAAAQARETAQTQANAAALGKAVEDAMGKFMSEISSAIAAHAVALAGDQELLKPKPPAETPHITTYYTFW